MVKLDANGFLIQITFEVEEVYFDDALMCIIEGGPYADVEHARVLLSLDRGTDGVDAVSGNEFVGMGDVDIGCGEAEPSAEAHAFDNSAFHGIGVSQECIGCVDIAAEERLANVGTAYYGVVHAVRWELFYVECATFGVGFEQRDIPSAAGAVAVVVTYDDF